ncbi:hypothetical protein IU500_01195 [Nocardia terpenica]|uniref:Uncharacterized protein n=1 Tax=Nocardia terpenica TaxID=455432 RepID=A0A164NKG4_9NOCA|nr:hypothetical protein [Nocardia terpenica]KZM74461.1 hypothetical protein AWN90_25675 [Nocardia terpenica]MBF6059808.1 hypothetical protein [Nocardia terpenica]MBF6102651.1 hypothetical protein [Nocardia terpenica]MBF6111158.1 hypothetical protein [Nocardia terpenica]MBF6117289.1 hypothetical protein [Nocardia terpenica]
MPFGLFRRPRRVPAGTVSLTIVVIVVAWFVLYAAKHIAGTAGAAVVLACAVAGVLALATRTRTRRDAARTAFLNGFAPPVRPAVQVAMAELHIAVQPFLSAGLPPLRVLPSPLDPGVWPTETGGAALRVGLPQGLYLDHLTAAAGDLARGFGVTKVVVRRDRSPSAAVLELTA